MDFEMVCKIRASEVKRNVYIYFGGGGILSEPRDLCPLRRCGVGRKGESKSSTGFTKYSTLYYSPQSDRVDHLVI